MVVWCLVSGRQCWIWWRLSCGDGRWVIVVFDGSMKRADRTNAIVSIKVAGVGYIRFLIVLTLDSI